MAKFINAGDSIEAEKALIATRRKTLKAKIEKNGKILFKYKCHTNSRSEITEELNPKVAQCKKTSSLNLGDMLEADIIEVSVSNLLTFKKEANYSSNHGIQKATSKGFTFAEIFMPFRHVVESAYKIPFK